MQRNFNGALVIAMLMAAATAMPALAKRGNDLFINDGFGEQVTVRHGFFGHNTEVVKDRLGDGYATRNGWFGTKDRQLNVLGNGFTEHKGIFGGSNIQGSTIFGDKVMTKKGIFGRRTTYVDASGTASVLRNLWQANKAKILGNGTPGVKNFFGNGNGPAPVPPGSVTPPSDVPPAPMGN